ncbi:MAG: NAD(P)/FAD-dependent oxidoreductase [Bacteroidales bacterium]|nr:NAD(P)/FAD-dependent oxidoreductase [Bacteroidales bacterium]
MKKRIIVVGGGFAGLQFIKNLREGSFEIVLIDRLNHHQFQPLFYQVATSQIEPSSISFPLRKIFQKRNDINIRLTEVLSVDPENNSIITSAGNFSFDYLVIATGCKTNFFGNEAIMKNALSLKTTNEAIKIRNVILENFENILNSDNKGNEGLFNIIIVGGGPTGVELSGAFAEIKRDILPKDYPGIDFSRLQIFLLEGSPYTLGTMSYMAKRASEKYLRKLGVILKTGVFVQNYDGDKLTLSNGETLKSKNVIWAAGITGNIIKGLSSEVITGSNRLKVDRMNRVTGYKNIYAIGDIAYMETPKYPQGHPQVANVAINQGKNLARNFRSIQNGEKLTEYEYKDLGSMATVGRNKAIVDLPFIRFKGYFAWYVWMFLHLMLILSVRNKLIIFINWAWNYFTKNSSLRLIIKVEGKNNDH